MAVSGECCPACRDSSNLLVLVSVSGAVSLSRVDAAFNVFYLSGVDIHWCVVFHYHPCLHSTTAGVVLARRCQLG